MNEPIKLTPVPPTSVKEVMAFVTRKCCGPDGEGECLAKAEGFACGLGTIRFSEHPEKPEANALRKMRVELAMSLGVAADKLGISVTEYSGLERGMYTADWEEAKRRIST